MKKIFFNLVTIAMLVTPQIVLADYFPSTGKYCVLVTKSEIKTVTGSLDRVMKVGEHQLLYVKPVTSQAGRFIYQLVPANMKVHQAFKGLIKGDKICFFGSFLTRKDHKSALIAFELE